MTVFRASVICVLFASRAVLGQVEDWPDYRTVAADLQVPQMVNAEPAAGQRVRRNLPQYGSRVYYSLHLPSDWQPGQSYPVIVEYAGNGGYRDALGDECSGRPEDCNLGYGMSAGVGFIWICLPYLNSNGNDLTIKWWGDAPAYDPQPTLKFSRAAVADVCANFGGESDRVILSGFSRGAIACNYLGLFDDETSRLWRAFVPCSHYDGVRRWPYPDSDAAAAASRLERLKGRPQFICGERDQIEETRKYLASFELQHITFASTGFRNHSDQWILRPSLTRDRLREWLTEVIRAPNSPTPNSPTPNSPTPNSPTPNTQPPTPNTQPPIVCVIAGNDIMAACDFSDPRIDEGIRLFNEGEYFACHDVLEDFWSELTCPEKPFFQGLIQAAVALFHFEGGNLGGARRMSISARGYMSSFAPSLGGIDVERLLSDLEVCFYELCLPHLSYPADIHLRAELIPKIHRQVD